MSKTFSFLIKIVKGGQKISIHLSIIILALGVVSVDYLSQDFSNTNIVFADSTTLDQIDTKKADALLSYVTSLVPPFDNGSGQSLGYLTEGTAFLNKPSITNTIISTLARDKITIYTISEGETYWTIAYKFELDIDSLLWANNIAVSDMDKIKAGNKLTILPVSGLLYTAVEGDTVQGVSDAFRVNKDKIINQNKLASNALEAGQQLVLPGAKKVVPKPAGAIPNYAGNKSYYSGSVILGTSNFIWPVGSPSRFISQYFGWVTKYYKHTGLDMDWRNGYDIIASDTGTVVAVGYGWGGGYGNHVIIDHGNGYQTLYAHLSRIYVNTGQDVSQGQSIGVMGTTGISTGVHLHFEIRQNAIAINPLIYIK